MRLDKRKLRGCFIQRGSIFVDELRVLPGRTRAGHQQTASFTPAVSQVLYYIVHVQASNERKGIGCCVA